MTSLKADIIAAIRRAIEAAPNADVGGIGYADDAKTRFLFVDIGELDLAEISDAILQLITTRLTSEEAVEAGYDATRLSDGTPQFADAGFCLGHAAKIISASIQAAIGRATHER